MRPKWAVATVLLFLLLALVLNSESISHSQGVEAGKEPLENPVKRSSSAIAITADGATIIAVNPDSNSISLIDAAGQLFLAEIPVGVDPRTVSVNDGGTIAYVANRGSDDVSVIDLAGRRLLTQIPVGAQPYGVLAGRDGKLLFVAEQGSGSVRILDGDSGETVRLLPVGAPSGDPTGDRPSGLALSNDGQTLYISHLLGNIISVLDISRPYAIFLPSIFTDQPASSLNHALSDTQPPGAIRLWNDSNLVQSIVLSPDGRLAYLPHTRSNSGNPNLSFDNTVLPLVSLIDLENQVHLTGQQFDLGTMDPPGVGLPFDAAVTPDGLELWVVNAASNDVTVINLENRELVAHIEVGDNPRGIVLSPDGLTAYINNTLSGTVSVVETASYHVTVEITTTEIPLPPLLLKGKKLFNSSDDPRMSNAQWIACSSCHFDGEHDGRTWTFAFAGPRNTTSLLGMIETYPLRWSGEWDESADGEFAIRRENFGSGLIEGEMHCDLFPADCVKPSPNQGRDDELDALAAFMDSLLMPLTPNHRQGQPLSTAALRGQALFEDQALGCLECHPPPLYSDLQAHDVGTEAAGEKIGPAYDTPTLRGLFGSEPYFHDGSADTLLETLTRPTPGSEHDLTALLTDSELQELLHYLLALPYER